MRLFWLCVFSLGTATSWGLEANVLPSTISYADPNLRYEEQSWNPLKAAFQAIGEKLRNSFYLPLYEKKIHPDLERNLRLSKEISYALQHEEVPTSKELQIVRRSFSIRDIDVFLEGKIVTTFPLRLFESKVPIEGKKLRLILFTFNGNTEQPQEGQLRAWNPSKIEALSQSAIAILQALQTTGMPIHSLITCSLGNVILDGLPTPKDTLPPTLLINRGLTSVKKTIHHLYSFPWNHLLHMAAQWFGWDADPEQKLLDFFQNNPAHQLIMIEAQRDCYFSEKGAFDDKYHEKMIECGVPVFRAKFWPYPFHSRSHHAIGLDHIRYNSETQVLANTLSFDLRPNEKMSSAIARNLFLQGDEEWHTCFCIGGSATTLDTGTVCEVLPLLLAFIEEGTAP